MKKLKEYLNKMLDTIDLFIVNLMLWSYDNLIHLFGFLGVLFSSIGVLVMFYGDFTLATFILSLAFGSLLLDILIKEKD